MSCVFAIGIACSAIITYGLMYIKKPDDSDNVESNPKIAESDPKTIKPDPKTNEWYNYDIREYITNAENTNAGKVSGHVKKQGGGIMSLLAPGPADAINDPEWGKNRKKP